MELKLDPDAIVARADGRDGWLREARRQLEEHRRLAADPVPRSRAERLLECERRLQENLRVEREANEAYEHYRAHGRDTQGRRLARPPSPYEPPDVPAGKINTTDLDSRNVKTPRSYTQGYNVQAVVNEQQIMLAAEVTLSSPDFGQLEPMITATLRELEQIGVSDTPAVALADTGYWHEQQIDAVVNMGTQVLIPPDAGKHEKPRRGWRGGRYAFMRTVLAGDLGGGLYRKRKAMLEPVFAQTKHNRRITQFQRRGRSAARSEWRLITATHNLMKLHKHHLAAQAAERPPHGMTVDQARRSRPVRDTRPTPRAQAQHPGHFERHPRRDAIVSAGALLTPASPGQSGLLAPRGSDDRSSSAAGVCGGGAGAPAQPGKH